MVNQVFNICIDIGKNSGAIGRSPRAIAIFLLLITNTLASASTEYVFTAPPEVDRQIVKKTLAPDTEYPLHECKTETAASDDVIDSHNCDCTDCEEKPEESEPDSPSTSEAKIKQP